MIGEGTTGIQGILCAVLAPVGDPGWSGSPVAVHERVFSQCGQQWSTTRRYVRVTPRVSVAFLQRKCGSLPNFTVIPAECPVGGSQLMIICPYPFCNAGWKSGLGRPVVLAQRSSLLREGRGKCR